MFWKRKHSQVNKNPRKDSSSILKGRHCRHQYKVVVPRPHTDKNLTTRKTSRWRNGRWIMKCPGPTPTITNGVAARQCSQERSLHIRTYDHVYSWNLWKGRKYNFWTPKFAFFFLGGGGWNIPLHPLVCSTSEGLTFLSVHTPSKPHVTTTARSNKSLFYPSRGRNSLWFT